MSCRERVGENEVRKEHEERSDDTEKITTKAKRTPHPYLRRYYHVLAVRMTGYPPVFRGKPLPSGKDTVE